ncbi:hypothetical protein HOY82DRAFT_574133 [Tuber indicum]|nr:hypothetical protein HOY82DRAFT_574133 [Tuber indicum]
MLDCSLLNFLIASSTLCSPVVLETGGNHQGVTGIGVVPIRSTPLEYQLAFSFRVRTEV